MRAVGTHWPEAEIGTFNPFVTSGSRGWGKYYSEIGDLFVRITNLSRSDIRLDLSDTKFVSLPASEREGIRTSVQSGDVLISITADIGVAGYVDERVPTPAYINQHIASVRFPKNTLDGRFVAYYLASEGPQKTFRAMTDTGAKAGMSLSTVKKIKVLCPPLHEQKAIASALNSIDDLIASLDALIAKKHDTKQAAMQQLLTGKTRLPGFSGEWKSKLLGELFELTMARSKAQYIEKGGRFWIVDMGSVTRSGKLSVSKSTNLDVDVLSRGDLVMPKDDIGGGNIIGRVGYIEQDGKYVCGDHVYRLRCRNGISLFYCFLINSDPINSMLRKQVVGSAQLGLGRKSVLNQPLWFPPLAEQSAIAEVIAEMDADLAALEDKREKVRGLRQGMMQQLLTGRIRLV